jgi:hypothetical protein
MIKIYIQNYFMENMLHKKNKTDNKKIDGMTPTTEK